jgi:transcriptional regulator with XRE-family HTH domain
MNERGSTLAARIRPSRLGEMLRLYRTMHQRTLREVAKECGISHATLMRIEHGQAFDAQTLLALWRWLLEEHAP